LGASGVGWKRLAGPGSDRSCQKLPTNLADLSVIGARLAVLKLASVEIAQEFVDASLVGRGICDAGTGIAGVCLC
jgi:hypothetical protein